MADAPARGWHAPAGRRRLQHHGLDVDRPSRGVARNVDRSRRDRCSSLAACRALRRLVPRPPRWVGTHAQGVAHEVAVTTLPRPRRSRVSPASHVALLEPQLGCVLDRDDAVGLGDHSGQHVQQRGLPVPVPPLMRMLARPCTQALRNSATFGERADAHQVVELERPRGELVDGEHGPSSASGGMIAFTVSRRVGGHPPSGRLGCGDRAATMRSITRMMWSSERKFASVSFGGDRCAGQMPSRAFTMISDTDGSSR